ncbi:MAG TPA: bifunctional glutamate N-acetyltransferase/amino-acid acetyltransferase ArgJ [Candidatus Paceibacterota bacterium]
MKTKVITGGIAAPIGFTASGMHCGIKKRKYDLSLIYSESPCVAAGVFTTNNVKASCVVVNAKHLADGKAQAIIANSGNANCMTGLRGFVDSEKMAKVAGRALGIAAGDVCVASTGLIGKALPIQNIEKAIPELVSALDKKGSADAAMGIMTTDHVRKEVAVEFLIGGKKARIGVIAKGAGMIHPQMALPHATMLCFVSTDVSIALPALHAALDAATQNSFNMITIDGDMSTNDMVLVLANGMAGNKKIVKGSKDLKVFTETLEHVFQTIAQRIVSDAEGATKFVEVAVRGARSLQDARKAARGIASSNLVKSALYGSDPNWGRIAAAVGSSGARVDQSKMMIYLGKELAVQKGGPVKKARGILDRVFAKKEIRITVDLGLGRHAASAYTCDLSKAYVELNSAYHT